MYFDDAILVHGKGNKERFVPVSPYLAKNLMQYRMARESYFEGKLPERYLFVSNRGKKLTQEADARGNHKVFQESGGGSRRKILCRLTELHSGGIIMEEASYGEPIWLHLLRIFLIVIIIIQVIRIYRANKEVLKRVFQPIGERSKWVGAILAFFFGMFGIHRYYLGYKKQGIMQSCSVIGLIIGYSCLLGDAVVLAIPCLFYSAAMGIWALVDFVCILTESLRPVDGMPYKENRVPQVRVNNGSASDSAEAIAKLAKLHEQGILTDEEFQQKKADLLAKM